MNAGIPRLAVVQARMGSTRLPGKSMFELGGQTLLEHVVHRALGIDRLDEVIVATSDQGEDDILVDLLSRTFSHEISVFRGSPLDVQERFLVATQNYDDALVGRVTADDPFRAPELFAQAFSLIERAELDHVRVVPGTVPVGIDAEVFRLSALRDSRARFPSAESAEHVTTALLSETVYQRGEVRGPDPSLGAISLTIDTLEDFDRCSLVAEALLAANLDHSLASTVTALRSLGWLNHESTERDAPL